MLSTSYPYYTIELLFIETQGNVSFISTHHKGINEKHNSPTNEQVTFNGNVS